MNWTKTKTYPPCYSTLCFSRISPEPLELQKNMFTFFLHPFTLANIATLSTHLAAINSAFGAQPLTSL